MIAFNELLANIDEYQNNLKLRGYKKSLKPFIVLGKKRKELGLKAELLRAETSKLCALIAIKKQKNKDLSNTMQQIESNEKAIKRLQKQLNFLNRQIDNKLKKLPNIANFDVPETKMLANAGNSSTVEELTKFIDTMFVSIKYDGTSKNYIKSLKNRLFQESELGIAAHCKNGIILLFQNYLSEDIQSKISNYLKQNSLSVEYVQLKNLSHSSSCEYLAKINNTTSVIVAIKAEYFSREYKIKYRNQEIDATKFVYEIDLLY